MGREGTSPTAEPDESEHDGCAPSGTDAHRYGRVARHRKDHDRAPTCFRTWRTAADPRRVDDPAVQRTRPGRDGGTCSRDASSGSPSKRSGAGRTWSLDFGVWSKDERSALRFLAAEVGAVCELHYVTASHDEQLRRIRARTTTDPHTSFEISSDELRRFRSIFQEPSATELTSSDDRAGPSWLRLVAARGPPNAGRRQSSEHRAALLAQPGPDRPWVARRLSRQRPPTR